MTVVCGHVFHLRCMKSLCDGTDHKNIYHVKCPVCAFDPTAVVDSGGGFASWRSGMGAMLVQADEKGRNHAIAYASKHLAKHERNYTPFLV